MANEITAKKANNYQLIFGKEEKRKEIASALPKGITLAKFQKTIYLACKKNPKIMECTHDSMYLAFIEAATMGLDPSVSNSCFFIPRKNKGVLELSMQVGYRTIINWIMNTGQIQDVNIFIVYEGEYFEITGGTSPGITHNIQTDIDKTWENIRFVYGVANTIQGGKIWRYLDKEEIKKRRKVAATDYIWKEWPVEMTLKTGLLYLSKFLPMNPEATQRIDKQEADIAGSNYQDSENVELEELKIKGSEQEADDILRPVK